MKIHLIIKFHETLIFSVLWARGQNFFVLLVLLGQIAIIKLFSFIRKRFEARDSYEWCIDKSNNFLGSFFPQMKNEIRAMIKKFLSVGMMNTFTMKKPNLTQCECVRN